MAVPHLLSGTDVTARTMANILEQEKIVGQRVVKMAGPLTQTMTSPGLLKE